MTRRENRAWFALFVVLAAATLALTLAHAWLLPGWQKLWALADLALHLAAGSHALMAWDDLHARAR